MKKSFPTTIGFNRKDSRHGLLEDFFLDSSSDDEDTFAGDENELTETNASLYDSLGDLSFGSSKQGSTKSGGLVDNLRTSFRKAKQLSLRHLQQGGSNRSLYSNNESLSNTESECDKKKDQSKKRIGELVNRKNLVKEQTAIRKDKEEDEFAKDLADLRNNLTRQESGKDSADLRNSLTRQGSETTNRSRKGGLGRSHSQRLKMRFLDARKDEYSTSRVQGSTRIISESLVVRTKPRSRNVKRSKSDPSQKEKMVLELLAEDSAQDKGDDDRTILSNGRRLGPKSASAQDLMGGFVPDDLGVDCADSRTSGKSQGRRLRAKSASAQDLMGGYVPDKDLGVDCTDAHTLVSDQSLELDGNGTTKQKSLGHSRKSRRLVAPLSNVCDSRKNDSNDASSNCTLSTQLIRSDDSDLVVEGEKDPDSVSTSKQEAVKDSRYCRSARPPLKTSTSLRKVIPVELPNCSCHHHNSTTTVNKKGQVVNVAVAGDHVETFVFLIDDHHPLVRSRHRGTSEYLQLNISNHSFSSLNAAHNTLGTSCV